MPQMAPLNWLNLFIMMMLIMMTISILIYFSFMNKMPKNTIKKKIFNNWKW